MKAIYFAALLLISCSLVKGGDWTCSDYPMQQSGVMIVFMAKYRIDMKPYNLDLHLQRFQCDMLINPYDGSKAMGPYNVIIDYEAAKKYVIFNGTCQTLPATEEMPKPPDLKSMALVAKGKLGLKGADVGLYGFKKNDTAGIITLEDDNMCIPEGFLGTTKGGDMTVSYLDTATTVDPSKFVIPPECKKSIHRRSVMMEKGAPLDFEIPLFF